MSFDEISPRQVSGRVYSKKINKKQESDKLMFDDGKLYLLSIDHDIRCIAIKKIVVLTD